MQERLQLTDKVVDTLYAAQISFLETTITKEEPLNLPVNQPCYSSRLCSSACIHAFCLNDSLDQVRVSEK